MAGLLVKELLECRHFLLRVVQKIQQRSLHEPSVPVRICAHTDMNVSFAGHNIVDPLVQLIACLLNNRFQHRIGCLHVFVTHAERAKPNLLCELLHNVKEAQIALRCVGGLAGWLDVTLLVHRYRRGVLTFEKCCECSCIEWNDMTLPTRVAKRLGHKLGQQVMCSEICTVLHDEPLQRLSMPESKRSRYQGPNSGLGFSEHVMRGIRELLLDGFALLITDANRPLPRFQLMLQANRWKYRRVARAELAENVPRRHALVGSATGMSMSV